MKRLPIDAPLEDRLREMTDPREVEGVRIWRELIGDMTERDAQLIRARELELQRGKK